MKDLQIVLTALGLSVSSSPRLEDYPKQENRIVRDLQDHWMGSTGNRLVADGLRID